MLLSARGGRAALLLSLASGHAAGERRDEESQRHGEDNLAARRCVSRAGYDARHDSQQRENGKDDYVTKHALARGAIFLCPTREAHRLPTRPIRQSAVG
jgi:hypothetical protein